MNKIFTIAILLYSSLASAGDFKLRTCDQTSTRNCIGMRDGEDAVEVEDELINHRCARTVKYVTINDHDGLNDIKMKIAKAHKITTTDPKQLLLHGFAKESRLFGFAKESRLFGEAPREIRRAADITSKDGRASIGYVAISDQDCSQFQEDEPAPTKPTPTPTPPALPTLLAADTDITPHTAPPPAVDTHR